MIASYVSKGEEVRVDYKMDVGCYHQEYYTYRATHTGKKSQDEEKIRQILQLNEQAIY